MKVLVSSDSISFPHVTIVLTKVEEGAGPVFESFKRLTCSVSKRAECGVAARRDSRTYNAATITVVRRSGAPLGIQPGAAGKLVFYAGVYGRRPDPLLIL
jgi:hypothetical protein